MMPVIPNTMRNYTGASPAYAGSSPYTIPDQPPFSNTLSRQHSQWRNPSISTKSSRNSRSSTRKPSLLFNNAARSSSTSTSSLNRSNSSLVNYLEAQEDLSRSSSTSSTASIGTSIKEFFHVPSREERAIKKAEKERQKRVQRAEDAAYRRAQDMEATAMYMAWSLF